MRLTSVDNAPEHKHVTVLFADVERSMDIAAALDIERLREVMTELVERSTTVLRRYGGTVEFNGDGVMALFGAPVALEDHALRACMAAVEVQAEAGRLATVVTERDGIDFRVRVGVNSGPVIVGEIGSGALGYRAIGETVGFAQRMESVAPPGGVMLSESTALLVEDLVILAPQQWVRVKGADRPAPVRQLLGIRPRIGPMRRAESSLVGRGGDMTTIAAAFDSAIDGRGGVLNVIAPPGIGKSRVAREAAVLAAARGVDAIWVFCESHARDISFGVVARLLRAATGVGDLDGESARARTRATIVQADQQDALLLDDLLGISDPEAALPVIDPDARRRRLTALIKNAILARDRPALVIVEDAQWIDAVSESMLSDFFSVVTQSSTIVLVTSRPEYGGAMLSVPDARAIHLAPLDHSDLRTLLGELLGADSTVGDVTAVIADCAGGNPFFAEEMVRELKQRGVIIGKRGDYRCRGDVSEVTVPATVQAAIAARIDRLAPSARQTLSAASVIGERFTAELLGALGFDVDVAELLNTELIEQAQFAPAAEYAFHHPLIRAVAYEAQLKSGRSEWHRRVAVAIEKGAPDALEGNAALIAEHLESAGELHAAYDWHLRAGTRLANRDVGAARVSWERASRIADALPTDAPESLPMRIAPRTMLCATGWQAIEETRGRVEELRQLCGEAGDQVSLAIGMTGLASELLYAGRSKEGSRLVSEQMSLMRSVDEDTTIGLGFLGFNNWFDAGEFDEMLRWSDVIVDLADGDPHKGAGLGFGSPLGAALAWRGVASWWLGLPGWQQDLHDAYAMGHKSDPTTLAMIVGWTYGVEIAFGVLNPDDSALRTITEAVETADGSSNAASSIVKFTLAVALLYRPSPDDRQRGHDLMAQVREMWVREPIQFLIPVADFCAAAERSRRGERDAVILVIREAVDDLHRAARPFFFVLGARVLVETLLERGEENDLAEVQQIIDRMIDLQAQADSPMVQITLLRSRALLSRARGEPAYPDLVRQYRAMADSLGYDGHLAWAHAIDA